MYGYVHHQAGKRERTPPWRPWATWPMEKTGEFTSSLYENSSWANMSCSRRASLFPCDYISFGVVLSQNDQSTSQNFVCFGWVHLPANPFFPQARLTGLSGTAPPPAPFWLLLEMYLPSPGPTHSLGLKGVGRDFSYPVISLSFHELWLYPLIFLAFYLLSVRTYTAAVQADEDSWDPSTIHW